MNAHEVRGHDFVLELKCNHKVTHAPELTADLMQTHHDLTAWRHTQINVKPDLVFIDLAQLFFCFLSAKIAWNGIDFHTPVILQLSKDKLSIYLMKRENWPNVSYILI